MFARVPALSIAVALAVSTGCCTCHQDAAVIAREIDSVLKRTEPSQQLTAAQLEKLLKDEETLRADIAALASGR